MHKFIKRAQDTAVYLARVMAAIVAGFAAFAPAAAMFGNAGWFFGLVVVSPIFSFAAIFIHEFGHAAGAWKAGMRLNRIVVMGLAYSPSTRKWSRANRPPDASDLGGWVEASEGRRYMTRKGETLYVAGGPAANLVSGILCFALSNLPMPYLASVILSGFGVFSIAMAFANLIPSQMNRAATDGLRLWRIWRPHRRRKPPKPSRSGWKRTPDF